MKNFTIVQLLKSLAFSVFTFGVAVYALFWEGIFADNVIGYEAVRSFGFPIAMMLFGGVLPAALTIFRNIHTERYFFKKLCAYGICCVLLFVVGQLTFGILSVIMEIAVAAVDIVFVLLKVQDEETTRGEAAVLFLPDLVLWICLDYCLMAFAELGNMQFI